MGLLKRLFGGTVAQPGGQIHDPSSPEYVPTPKAKDPAAQHPLVAAKALKPQGKARGVGIVYGADGRPRITRDWLDNLSPEQRAAVDKDLLANGWRVNENYSIDKVPPVGTPLPRIAARS
jgi:hypothetical protein